MGCPATQATHSVEKGLHFISYSYLSSTCQLKESSFLLYLCLLALPLSGQYWEGWSPREDVRAPARRSASEMHWPSLIQLPGPTVLVLKSASASSPGLPSGSPQSTFLFLLHALPPALATRGRFVTRFWKSQPFLSSGLEHTRPSGPSAHSKALPASSPLPLPLTYSHPCP